MTTVKIMNISIISQNSSCLFGISLSPRLPKPPILRKPLICCLSLWISLHILEFCINIIHSLFFFGLTFFTQSDYFEIHSCYAYINTSFIFIVSICHNVFIHSLVDGRLGGFQLLAVTLFCCEHSGCEDRSCPSVQVDIWFYFSSVSTWEGNDCITEC